jgi:hypothetical protein
MVKKMGDARMLFRSVEIIAYAHFPRPGRAAGKHRSKKSGAKRNENAIFLISFRG